MKQTTYNVIRTTLIKSLVSWYVYERLEVTAVFFLLRTYCGAQLLLLNFGSCTFELYILILA